MPAHQTHTGWAEGVSRDHRAGEADARRKAFASDEKGKQSGATYPFSRFLKLEHPRACTDRHPELRAPDTSWAQQRDQHPLQQAQGDGTSLVLIGGDDRVFSSSLSPEP